MKKYFLILAISILTGYLCVAQGDKPTIIEDFKPSVLNQPGKEYPMVNSDRWICVQLSAKVDKYGFLFDYCVACKKHSTNRLT